MPGRSMKIFKVIEGLKSWNLPQSSVNNSSKPSLDIEELLRSDEFSYRNITTHGFPSEPCCLAFDPIQKLLAIGNRCGNIKIFGKSEVEYSLSHPTDAAVIKIIFLVNQGQLLSICQDDIIHLWSIKSKPPEIIQSLQFKRERVTSAYLSLKSNWLYVGTERGNVNFVNISNFSISGYVINWNKAIELSQSNHPGKVVQIAECPQENNKILIGYQCGVLTLWDLKSRQAEARYRYSDNLHGFSWNFEGKSFMTCHSNGILATWSTKQQTAPISFICPHSCNDNIPTENNLYEPIRSIQWVGTQNGEPFVIFCGGGYLTPVPNPKSNSGTQSFTNPLPSITVMRGKRLAVMQMDYPVVDFITLSESPYDCDPQDPYAVSVLLKSDLVVIDILSPNYPSFENPYPIDLHTSPVTAIHYVSDCPKELILGLYLTQKSNGSTNSQNASELQAKGKDLNSIPMTDTTSQNDGSVFSTRDWPINGGSWAKNVSQVTDLFSELIITGHADGSIRFWNANGMNLVSVSKFRTCKIFRISKHEICKQNSNTTKKPTDNHSNGIMNNHFSPNLIEIEEDPLAIKFIKFCPESRKILLGSLASMVLLKFSREDANIETPFIDVNATFETFSDFPPLNQFQSTGDDDVMITGSSQPNSPDSKITNTKISSNTKRSTSQSSYPSNSSYENKDLRVFLQLKAGIRNWKKGYQPELVCRLGVPSLSFELSGGSSNSCILPPSQITAISFNSEFGLMAFGNDSGLVVIDYVHNSVLLQLSTNDLYENIRPPKELSRDNVSSKESLNHVVNSLPGHKTNGSILKEKIPDEHANHGREKSPLGLIDEHEELKSFQPSGIDNLSAEPLSMNAPSSPYNTGSSSKPTFVSKNAMVRSELKRAKSQAALSQKFTRNLPGIMNVHAISIDKCDIGSCTPAKESLGQTSTPPYSTSSSISSLEQFGTDTIKILEFSVLPMKKRNQIVNRNVFMVGTKLGSVLIFELNNSDSRNYHPVNIIPSGISFRRLGDMISLDVINQTGDLFIPPFSKWSSASPTIQGTQSSINRGTYSNSSGVSSATQSSANLEKKLGSSTTSLKGLDSELATNQNTDVRLLILISDKHIKVVSFPSINVIYKIKLSEKMQCGIAKTCQLKNQAFISTYSGSGHLSVYSLPSLRCLIDYEIPMRERPVLNPYQSLISFGLSHGLFIYMKNSSELVKASVCNETSGILDSMMPDLMICRPMPEPMKKNFFKSFFTTSVISANIDKDELFGVDASNKNATAVVLSQSGKPITNLNERANEATSEIGRAKMAAIERGEKLGQLDQQTEEMMNQAKAFSKTASALAAKYERKNNRWGF